MINVVLVKVNAYRYSWDSSWCFPFSSTRARLIPDMASREFFIPLPSAKFEPTLPTVSHKGMFYYRYVDKYKFR
jgi:hypothetical protein